MIDKWSREKERIASIIDEFRIRHQKPTKWEDRLCNALRESNQLVQHVGTKMDQLLTENSTFKKNSVASTASSSSPLSNQSG